MIMPALIIFLSFWSSGVITVNDLYKSFPMGGQTLTVLKGVNLQIQRGELIAIVGASGAGKSTLLHIIGTLDRPMKVLKIKAVDFASQIDELRSLFVEAAKAKKQGK